MSEKKSRIIRDRVNAFIRSKKFLAASALFCLLLVLCRCDSIQIYLIGKADNPWALFKHVPERSSLCDEKCRAALARIKQLASETKDIKVWLSLFKTYHHWQYRNKESQSPFALLKDIRDPMTQIQLAGLLGEEKYVDYSPYHRDMELGFAPYADTWQVHVKAIDNDFPLVVIALHAPDEARAVGAVRKIAELKARRYIAQLVKREAVARALVDGIDDQQLLHDIAANKDAAVATRIAAVNKLEGAEQLCRLVTQKNARVSATAMARVRALSGLSGWTKCLVENEKLSQVFEQLDNYEQMAKLLRQDYINIFRAWYIFGIMAQRWPNRIGPDFRLLLSRFWPEEAFWALSRLEEVVELIEDQTALAELLTSPKSALSLSHPQGYLQRRIDKIISSAVGKIRDNSIFADIYYRTCHLSEIVPKTKWYSASLRRQLEDHMLKVSIVPKELDLVCDILHDNCGKLWLHLFSPEFRKHHGFPQVRVEFIHLETVTYGIGLHKADLKRYKTVLHIKNVKGENLGSWAFKPGAAPKMLEFGIEQYTKEWYGQIDPEKVVKDLSR